MAHEERPMAPPLIGGLIFSCFICQSLYTILITFELCSVIHNDVKRQHCIFSICSELSKRSLILTASQGSSSIYGWENKIDWVAECILMWVPSKGMRLKVPPEFLSCGHPAATTLDMGTLEKSGIACVTAPAAGWRVSMEEAKTKQSHWFPSLFVPQWMARSHCTLPIDLVRWGEKVTLSLCYGNGDKN